MIWPILQIYQVGLLWREVKSPYPGFGGPNSSFTPDSDQSLSLIDPIINGYQVTNTVKSKAACCPHHFLVCQWTAKFHFSQQRLGKASSKKMKQLIKQEKNKKKMNLWLFWQSYCCDSASEELNWLDTTVEAWWEELGHKLIFLPERKVLTLYRKFLEVHLCIDA